MPQRPPPWGPYGRPPLNPTRRTIGKGNAWFLACASVVVLAVVVLAVWGLSTHGFRDMHSYNLGRDALRQRREIAETNGVMPDCIDYLVMAELSHESVNRDDFLAGCYGR